LDEPIQRNQEHFLKVLLFVESTLRYMSFGKATSL